MGEIPFLSNNREIGESSPYPFSSYNSPIFRFCTYILKKICDNKHTKLSLLDSENRLICISIIYLR